MLLCIFVCIMWLCAGRMRAIGWTAQQCKPATKPNFYELDSKIACDWQLIHCTQALITLSAKVLSLVCLPTNLLAFLRTIDNVLTPRPHLWNSLTLVSSCRTGDFHNCCMRCGAVSFNKRFAKSAILPYVAATI